jgi:hypothetical protein
LVILTNDSKLQPDTKTPPYGIQKYIEETSSKEGEKENDLEKEGVCYDYPENQIIASESQETPGNNVESSSIQSHTSKKLFGTKKSNNFIYLDQNGMEQSTPAIIATPTMFDCYYCDDFHTNLEEEYRRHGVIKHPNKPLYPSKADQERHHLKPQQKRWKSIVKKK